jgi:intracellular sulfur oxidation DsrE/DsrF family protein
MSVRLTFRGLGWRNAPQENIVLRKLVRAVLFGAVVLIGFTGLASSAEPAAGAGKDRVVLQVSDADPGKWNLALNNARNLQADLGADKVEIEIVAYGPGIGMLKRDSAVGSRVDEALAAGVQVVACENTMRGQKLAKADMLAGVGYVGAGVVEIMRRQQQGWSYLRP